jgi:outer membrane protein OmpA-like peptidoglycan-associated protein
MKRFKIISFTAVGFLMLLGCTQVVDTNSISNMSPKGNAFQNALHQEYVRLALSEEKENDSDDAFYFIEKAKLAAMGKSPGPQPLEERMLPESNKGELAKARLQLVNKLWEGSADVKPAAAARSQAMFDCWMQEQEEDIQPNDITACKTEFKKAYALLSTTAQKLEKPQKKETPKKLPFPFHVYFETDSADLDSTAKMTIKLVVSDYLLHKPGSISISAHTDTVGSKNYNKGLSHHRAATVGKELIKLGIPLKSIASVVHGEEKLAVKTDDNIDEKYNRVVKITFKW